MRSIRPTLLAILLSIVTGGWGSPPCAAPVATTRASPAERIPVILVPGLTGSRLRDRETGELVWGSGGRLVNPHDSGYSLAEPVVDRPETSRLEAFELIDRLKLLLVVKKDVYGPIFDLLSESGYLEGDLEAPDPVADFFPFPYDWRLDNTIAARRLAERLEALRRDRGVESLRVTLVCQSSGGQICRWFSKYGGASLAEAEADGFRRSERVQVDRMILVGTANGGSLRILREIHRGRRYVPVIGRRLRPETLFTFTSLYQDLPSYRDDCFVDEAGEPLDVDVFDAEAWVRYGWSVFGRKARTRIDAAGRDDLFGNEDARRAFLERTLSAAARYQRLLARDVEGQPVPPIYLIQNRDAATPDRAVLVEGENGWETWFTGDSELRGNASLIDKISADGDGHATVESQMWLSPAEHAAIAREPAYVNGHHFDLILDPEGKRFLLEFVSDTGSAERPGG